MNTEQYENLIALLQKALEFYGDKNNYHGAMGNVASIDIDENGSQARFALKKIEEFRNINKNLETELEKNLNNAIESNKSFEDIIEIIEQFKNINDGN